MRTKNVCRVVIAVIVGIVLMMAFASVVSAGGLRLWVAQAAPVYWTPSTTFPVKGEVLAVGDEVLYTTFFADWVRLEGPGYWVQGTNLTQEEPVQIKTMREQSEYKVQMMALAAKKMNELTASEYYSLTQYLAASAVPTQVAAVPATTAAPAALSTTVVYTIVKGDTLKAIADKYGVTVSQLVVANGISDPNRISVGQTLVIPSATGATTAPAALAASANPPTAFGPRDCLVVNGTKTCLEGQDLSDVRAMFHTETGIAQGKQFTVSVPKDWSLGVFGVSAEVVQNGKLPVQYTGGPALIIRGPWQGQIGVYEAGLHGVPSEWENFLTTTIFASHRKYVPAATLTYLP